MNIYKVNYLTSVSTIKTTCVFYGPHEQDLEALFSTDPENKLFSGIFSTEELEKIRVMNIPVSFSQQYLHSDDTIGTLKSKIAHQYNNAFSIDELFMFGREETILSANIIHRILTQNNKLQLTKKRLSNFLSNVVKPDDGTPVNFVLPDNMKIKGSDIYTYNDLLELDMDNKPFLMNKPLGQKYLLQDGEYPYVCNPYEMASYDSDVERMIKKSVTTLNNNVLLNGGKLHNNNIYMCVASDVLVYSDTLTTIELYYPMLYNKEITSLDILVENQPLLIEESKKKYAAKLYDQIDLFYDIYKPQENDPSYSSKGIKSLHVIVRQRYIIKTPTNVVFKIAHSSQDTPYIRYNPALRQEKMIRLYCDKNTTNNKKVPYLSKAKILNLIKNANTRTRSMTIYFSKIDAICHFDESGDISIEMEFNEAKTSQEVDEVIKSNINPFFQKIQKYLSQHGYIIDIFKNLNDISSDIQSINYEIVVPIDKKIKLSSISGCVSSIFVTESDDISKGLKMRYKRVSNFNKMTSMEAFILEKQKQGLRDADIVNRLIENYGDITRENAIDLLAKLASQMQIERGSRKNIINVKSNPGFKTLMELNPITGQLTMSVDNINDIRFLEVIPIYLLSFISLTQNPSSLPVSKSKINAVCKGEIDESEFEDIVAAEDLSYLEKKNAEDAEEEDEVPNYDVGEKEKIDDALDMFFGEDEEEEEEDEEGPDEKTGGGDSDNEEEDTITKNIENLKLNNPDYFTERIRQRDPVLILNKPQGKFNSYNRICHKNTGRLPVILTPNELDKINREHPGFLKEQSDVIKYGSKPDNQYYYICPRYWDLKRDTIITPEEVEEQGLQDKVISLDAKTPGKGKYIYEFNDRDPKKYDPNRKAFPNFAVDKHPDGYCLPCCFNKWAAPDMIKRKERCSGSAIAKKKVVERDDGYILGPGKFPLTEDKFGYLPTAVQHMIGHKQTECEPNKICLLRHGVEYSKNQSFIACIADAICYTKKPVYSITEMKQIIIAMLTIDNFIVYQNGTLVTEFYDKDRQINVNAPKYTDSRLFSKTRGEPNKIAYFAKVCNAFEGFSKFLASEDATIDYTYLWDLLSTPHPSIFENGANLVILEVPMLDITDNVNIVCPTNHYTSKKYDPSKPTLIFFTQDGFFEPIFTLRTTHIEEKNQDVRYVGKFFREQSADSIPEIKFLFEMVIKPFYEKMCKPMASMPKVYNAKHPINLKTLLDICKENDYALSKQIVNYQGKVIGVMVKPTGFKAYVFVPCFPSAVDISLDYEFMLNTTIWNGYTETRDTLQFIQRDTGGLVPCVPVFKVIEDEVIVGIITETNQFVQLSQPEPVSKVSDTLREIKNNNYMLDSKSMISTDSVITSSSEIDKERVEYVKKVRLETQFYQAFRNTIRTMLNDPKYNVQRIALEKECNQLAVIYSTKLKNVVKMLREMASSNLVFVNDYNYKVIKDIHTCIVNEDAKQCKAESPLCSVSSNGKCQLLLPKKNLLNDADNETNYFLQMADELIRYRRIRQFMFEPQVYLSFGNVDYKVDDHELLIMQSMLSNDFFDGLIGKKINNYMLHTSYDNVAPQTSAFYNNTIKIK